MSMVRRWIRRLAILWMLGLAAEASACPNCKEAVANQGGAEAQRLADGYSYSILMMIAMPFTLLGTGAFLVARAVKRGVLPEM